MPKYLCIQAYQPGEREKPSPAECNSCTPFKKRLEGQVPTRTRGLGGMAWWRESRTSRGATDGPFGSHRGCGWFI